jgi:hypothetical protein
MLFEDVVLLATTGFDAKDCLLAWDNQIWPSGKHVVMQTCPSVNQIFCCFADI